jgi:hypothetical protein
VLQPFVCAAILGRRWDWLYIPVAILVLTAFVMREPLLILARQKWIWKEAKSESVVARRCLLWQLPLSAVLGAVCLAFLPAVTFLILALVAMTITFLATWMALHNRQRSIALQIVSSLGLTSTGLLAALVAVRSLPDWSWLLCGLLALHATASIVVVRTRLELRSGARAQTLARWAWALQVALGCLAVWLVLCGRPGLALVVGFTAVVGTAEMLRLRSPGALAEPLREVGFRALGASLAHSAFSVVVLWQAFSIGIATTLPALETREETRTACRAPKWVRD